MSYEIRADYKQQFLLPPSLEDLIPKDHPARFIREFVDCLDMKGLGFHIREAQAGRPNYSSDLLLKTWLYGLFEGIRSCRRLEKACMQDIGLIWLNGMNYPDHNTLWRFFRDNRKVLSRLFKRSVQVAAKGGLVAMVLNVVDGTRIKADVSKRRAWHKEDLARVLKHLEEAVEEICGEVEAAERGEEGLGYRLPAEFSEPQRLKEFVRKGLEELEREGRSHLSLTDKEARMMKTENGIEFAYNAQVVVDDKAGLVVAEDVVQDESDNHKLVGMVEQAAENVGKAAEETVADGGYFSGEELKKADDRGYGVVVNINDRSIMGDEEGIGSEFHRSKFQYIEGRDVCICPKGGVLEFEGIRVREERGYGVRVYRCRDYKGCAFRERCSRNKRGRTIGISPYHESIRRQVEKQKEPEKRGLLYKRGATVERIFGFIKHVMGWRRWTVRGLENVRGQWALICTVVNLKKIYKVWAEGNIRLI